MKTKAAPNSESLNVSKEKQERPGLDSADLMQGKGKDKGGDSKGSSPVDPAPVAAMAELRSPGLSLKQAIATRAQRMVKKQFGRAAGRDAETAGMKLLREICGDLGKQGSIARLLGELKEGEGAGVSTFEFLSSGAVQQLRAYLLGKASSCLSSFHL